MAEFRKMRGLVYKDFDRKTHVLPASKLPDMDSFTYGFGIDFGFTNPFCAQWWALDPDGRMYMYRELYGTQTLVEDWAHEIHTLSQKEKIMAYICDHDAEDRATLERHLAHDENHCTLGMEKGFANRKILRKSTLAANKTKLPKDGIQDVKSRLREAGDGKPRLFLFRDALAMDPDPQLVSESKPTCTEEEIEGYVWDRIEKGRFGERTTENPRKINDHGMDALRYAVIFADKPVKSFDASVWGKAMKHGYGTKREATSISAGAGWYLDP